MHTYTCIYHLKTKGTDLDTPISLNGMCFVKTACICKDSVLGNGSHSWPWPAIHRCELVYQNSAAWFLRAWAVNPGEQGSRFGASN